MITGQTVALFIHILGAITLFIAMGIVQRVGALMRSASSGDELRQWLRLLRSTSRMYPAAFVTLLVTGLYMAGTAWSFETPWIAVSLATLLVMGALGGGFVGRSFREIGQSFRGGGELTPEMMGRVRAPRLWIAATALNGLAMGVLWLMVVKPGLVHSLAVVLALGLIGAVGGRAAAAKTA